MLVKGTQTMSDSDNIHHVCNVAANLIPAYRILGQSYEDRDLDSIEVAEEAFEWYCKYTPGTFVMITTGDYITPTTCLGITKNASKGTGHPYHDCETYDPLYRRLLVPTRVWDEVKAAVMAKDRSWRIEKEYCFDMLRETDYWWWHDETKDENTGSPAPSLT